MVEMLRQIFSGEAMLTTLPGGRYAVAAFLANLLFWRAAVLR